MEARTCQKCEGRGCGSCGGVGQVQVAPDLRTFDPATHVVVSREAAKTAYSWVMGFVDCGGMQAKDYAALAELRAALEGKSC